jgi:hypothetical protein
LTGLTSEKKRLDAKSHIPVGIIVVSGFAQRASLDGKRLTFHSDLANYFRLARGPKITKSIKPRLI